MVKVTIEEQFERDKPLIKDNFTSPELTKSVYFFLGPRLHEPGVVAPPPSAQTALFKTNCFCTSLGQLCGLINSQPGQLSELY